MWTVYTLEYYPALNEEFLTFMATWIDEHEINHGKLNKQC